MSRSPIVAAISDGVTRRAPRVFSANSRIEVHEANHKFVRDTFAASGPLFLDFQFVNPEVTDTIQPNYEEISTIGRPEPYQSYAGGSQREIQLELVFCDSVTQQDSGQPGDALQSVRWLQALMMPSFDSERRQYPPPLCRLILGKTYVGRGVVKACAVTQDVWSGSLTAYEYPMLCRASLTFGEVNTRPRSAADLLRRVN